MSLLIGYINYILLYNFPKTNVATKCYQWVLGLNVLEAGFMGIQHNDYLLGSMLIALAPFSPEFRLNDNKTLNETKSNIFLKTNFL